MNWKHIYEDAERGKCRSGQRAPEDPAQRNEREKAIYALTNTARSIFLSAYSGSAALLPDSLYSNERLH
jgi:hypothetical protein